MVNRVYHLDRGFERLEEKLSACGAQSSASAIDFGVLAAIALHRRPGLARNCARGEGPIPRDLWIEAGWPRPFSVTKPVVMGPGVRRDDGDFATLQGLTTPPPPRH